LIMPANGDLSQMLQMADSPCDEFLKELPKDIKRRVCALKNLQLQSLGVESEFYERVHQLEKEFEIKFNKLYEERRKVVLGEKEPTDEEANVPLIHGATEEELAALNETAPETSGEKGIPNFWSHVFQNCETIADMIQEHDKDILNYLVDVTTTVETIEEGFSLSFYFTQNPYFKNSVLTKRYFLQMKPEEDNPFEFDGPSVVRTIGDKIEWEDGKDVTKKVIKKKSKKGANAGKFLTKTIKADSFFNFFDPPSPCDGDHKNEDDDDLEEHELLRADFELGQLLRDIVVPRAVLFYTGEQTEDDFLDAGDFEDDDDDDMEDEED